MRQAGWTCKRRTRWGVSTVQVLGESMAPELGDGQVLIVLSRAARVPRLGDLLVFENPTRANLPPALASSQPRLLVKQVAGAPGDPVPDDIFNERIRFHGCVPADAFLVRGTAPHSQDSRHFGYIPAASVVGIGYPLCLRCFLMRRRTCQHWRKQPTGWDKGHQT